MPHDWVTDLAGLLNDLSATQEELLRTLREKRTRLLATDPPALSGDPPHEEALVERLRACHARRGELLARAEAEGLPSASIRELSGALAGPEARQLAGQIEDAASRSRMLQHQSLVNWVVVQRTLIHLSQLLEIIATGGKQRPTYGKGTARDPSGSLVDQAA
jgi:FlgN protein